jgi:SagB-type dehydrogenase family enzyme
MVPVNPPSSVLLPQEQRELWADLNDSAVEIPDLTVAQLFARNVEEHPDAQAFVSGRIRLTYRELDLRARSIADRIRRAGTEPGQAVVVSTEPGWEQVAAVMGAMFAGTPLHPVNPNLPQPVRWRRIAEAGATVVLTQSWLVERLDWPPAIQTIELDGLDGEQTAPDGPRPDTGMGDVACVLAPDDGDTEQGGALVALAHGSLVNTVVDVNRRFGIRPGDRMLTLAPLGDQVSMFAVLGALTGGLTLVMPEDIDLRTPAAWVALMDAEEVTIWCSVPSLAVLLAEHVRLRGEGLPRSVRLFLLGGELMAPLLVDRIRALREDPPRVVYLGGTPHAGLWSCGTELHGGGDTAPHKHVPIGAPLGNQHVYVLSEAMTPCPVWVTGRVHYGGRGLAAGEWRAGVLEPDPAATELPGTAERLHRSAQRGRLLPGGVVEIVGEDATQISVSGHPTNLRDIEGALAGHPSVLAAAVVPTGQGSRAHVKIMPGGRVSGQDLLEHLRTKMSPLLLPDRVELVAVLPLTPSGRIDRAALTAASTIAEPTRAETPSGATSPGDAALTERACAIAADVLGIPEVEPTMNLLDLGATSPQMVQLAVRAEEELGIMVDVEELLQFPSIEVLVSYPGGIVGRGDDSGERPDQPQPSEPRATVQHPEGQATALLPAAEGLITDPVAREAFKERRLGLRADLQRSATVALIRPPEDVARLTRRRTHRSFRDEPVEQELLGRLLSTLRQFRAGTEPKFAYPSAGSAYPVQAYVSVAPGRVQGVPAGTYYFHPVRNGLVALAEGAQIDAGDHAWINRAAFRSSAFSIYLVARLAAIVPLYGKHARDFCLLEAGAISQLLMTEASSLGLGLCPIGVMDTTSLNRLLSLDDQDELVHTLFGGLPGDDGDDGDDGRREVELLERVQRLSLTDMEGTAEPGRVEQ